MAKLQTQASYQARLDRVVDHIYAHLDEDMRPEGLAEIACLSSYHWHRIYVAMRGETIGATIRRPKLQRAADRLANSDLSIGKIVERAGYSGVDAFARAFREAYGNTPADYRATGSHAAFKAATEAEDHAGFRVAIETLPPTRCASVAHKGAYLLAYLKEPSAALRRRAKSVRPGGIVAMVEFDVRVMCVSPHSPLHQQVIDWIVDAFEGSGVNPSLGSDIAKVFHDAGLPWPSVRSVQYAAAGPDGPLWYYGDLLRTLMPNVEGLGLATTTWSRSKAWQTDSARRRKRRRPRPSCRDGSAPGRGCPDTIFGRRAPNSRYGAGRPLLAEIRSGAPYIHPSS
jgi:AraC-like DNA-binding protein